MTVEPGDYEWQNADRERAYSQITPLTVHAAAVHHQGTGGAEDVRKMDASSVDFH